MYILIANGVWNVCQAMEDGPGYVKLPLGVSIFVKQWLSGLTMFIRISSNCLEVQKNQPGGLPLSSLNLSLKWRPFPFGPEDV